MRYYFWPITFPGNTNNNALRGRFLEYMIYLLTAVGLTPGGSSTVHIYTQTLHKTTQLILEECESCLVFACSTPEFVLQLRKKQGKPSVMVAEECHLAR
jgi:uncharacterized integral membrane protein